MTLPVLPPDIGVSSILPPMEAGSTLLLWALPPLILSGLTLRLIAIQQGYSRFVWPFLIILSASLIALSITMPTLYYYRGLTQILYGYAHLKSLPSHLIGAYLWTLVLVSLTLMGLKDRKLLSSITVCGVASFYFAYPIIYTACLGQGLLGPSIRETFVIATAFIVLAELSAHVGRSKQRAFFLSTFFCAILSTGLAMTAVSLSKNARAFVTF